MKESERDLLMREIRTYVQGKNYEGKRIRTMEVCMISEVAAEFGDRRSGMQRLLDNDYGRLGNLMFRYTRAPDEEITELMDKLDEKLVLDAYRRFGTRFLSQGNGASKRSMKYLLKADPELIAFIRSPMQDREFAMEVAGYCPDILKKMGPDWRRNREFVREMIEKNPACYEHADWRLRRDREITFRAVRLLPENIRHADYILRKERDLMLMAVARNGMLLFYADERLKDDEEAVRKAVASAPLALRYASPRLQEDRELIKLAERKER